MGVAAVQKAPRTSLALPFMNAPGILDGTLAGDMGFDPLGFADCRENLLVYREAEVKHARLAMLAAAGWPLAEKFNGPLSAMLGTNTLLQDGRAPSVLNGGLDQVSVVYWVAALGLAVYVESKSIDAQLNTGKRADDYLPGMMGFDPLGMDSETMRGAEIINGRIAMLAITAFALEEALFKSPVVSTTAVFFQPIWTTLG